MQKHEWILRLSFWVKSDQKTNIMWYRLYVESKEETRWSYQPYLTLCNPMDCSLPGSSLRGIFQTRVLEWVAISFSRISSQPKDRTQVSHIAGRHFTVWATRDVESKKGYNWAYLQNINIVTDVENKFMPTKGKGIWEGINCKVEIAIHTIICKIDNY